MPQPLRIVDVTLRDGQQTLLSGLLSGSDLVRVAAALDSVGLAAIEAWGGGTFEAAVTQLHADPWELLEQLNQATPRTPLQVMLRGQNLVGDRNYADDVVEAFVRQAAARGADIFRVFDPLNDRRNMDRVMAAVKEAGRRLEGGICYTVSPSHSTAALVELAVELVEGGCDAIWIKDTAGLLTPTTVTELVSALTSQLEVPVAVHSHSTRGLGGMVHLAAALAGADAVDACLSPLSGGASHPPTESLVVAAAGTDRDTGLDPGALDRASEVLAEIMTERGLEADPHLSRLDASLFRYGIPGTMMSEIRARMATDSLPSEKLDQVLEEVTRVRAELGNPPLLMPVSRLIAEQAVLNVARPRRYDRVAHDVRAYVEGLYGRPPGPVHPDVQRAAIGSNEPISMRPADLVNPELPGAAKSLKKERIERTDVEAVLTVAILGRTALPFLRGDRAPVGSEPEPEPRETAEQQMTERAAALGGEVAPDSSVSRPEPAPGPEAAPGPQLTTRAFSVEVDGQVFEVKVTGEGGMSIGPGPASASALGSASASASQAPPAAGSEGAIAAPMQGLLLKVKVAVGDRVALGDVVAVLEAMKMQNDIVATAGGTVRHIYASEGSVVSPNQVLMTVN